MHSKPVKIYSSPVRFAEPKSITAQRLDSPRMAACKLLGHKIECAGCVHRAIVMGINFDTSATASTLSRIKDTSFEDKYRWTECCIKNKKSPTRHSSQLGLDGSIGDFKTPCSSFLGASYEDLKELDSVDNCIMREHAIHHTMRGTSVLAQYRLRTSRDED